MISFFSRLFKKAPNKPINSKPSTKSSSGRSEEPTNVLKDTTPQAYGPELLQQARQDSNTKQRTAARQRIAALLESKALTFENISGDAIDTADLLALCSYDADTSSKILSTYTNQHELAELANKAPTTQLRKAAAEKVTERSALELMLKEAKGKDKNVYKIAKMGLAVFKEQDEALEQRRSQLESLCVDAERHSKKPFDHLYNNKFVTLEQQWQELEADTTQALQERFDVAIAKCQATIDAEVAKGKQAALAEQLANSLVDKIATANAEVAQLAIDLFSCDSSEAQALSALKDKLVAVTRNTQNAIDSAADAAINDSSRQKRQQGAQQSFYQTTEAAQALVALIEVDGSLSTLLAKLDTADDDSAQEIRKAIEAQLTIRAKNLPNLACDVTDRAAQTISQWQKDRNTKNADRKALIGNVSDLIRRANIAANSGQIRRARGIVKELAEKREKLQDIPLGIVNKLELLDETIHKLGDWHNFAVTPKKQALVDEMTQLQTSNLAPDDLADKIHELQEQWKLLCKGGENQDEELWEAFQKSADIAFEPCKAHFAEQAQMRENNAVERKTLLEQLDQYYLAYDWEKAVWKDVEQTLRVAKDTWKQLWPVPRQQQKDLQGNFDAILDKIYAHMNAAYDAAKVKKEQLIAMAQKASQHADPKKAAEEIKQLQQNWKNAGRTFRKMDQQLWNQFREVCDEIFNQRQALFDKANAERDEFMAKANDIIAQLKTIADNSGELLQTQGAAIADLKNELYQISDIPKAISAQAQDIAAKIEQKIAQHRRALERGTWKALFDLNTEIATHEEKSTAGSQVDAVTIEHLTQTLDSTKLPAGTTDLLKERINLLQQDKATYNTSEAEKALRLLCIRAEIMNNIDANEEDKKLRMSWQVEALQQNFGGNVTDTAEELTKQWVAIGGCPSTVLKTLQKRFVGCTLEHTTTVKDAVPA